MRWMALLAVAVGLNVLTGGAEAIVDALAAVALYAGWQLVSQARRGAPVWTVVASVGWMVLGLVAGVALGTAQWLPGLSFTSQSQRATTSYQYFTTGSLANHLLVLIFSPFVLGSNQPQPGNYVGQYNFPEATSYAGILALIAVFVLLARRFRTRPEARAWRVWYAVIALGLLSALGGETPFGRLLYLLPVVRDERLLNRNLLLVDFGLAALLGWWSHMLLQHSATESGWPARGRCSRGGGSDGRPGDEPRSCSPVHRPPSSWSSAPPSGSTAHSCSACSMLLEASCPPAPGSSWPGWSRPWRPSAVVATAVVLGEWRTSRHVLRRRLAAVLVCDLVLFTTFVLHVPITEADGHRAGPDVGHLGGPGRATAGSSSTTPTSSSATQLFALGQTDLNVFGPLGSGQGYTALTDGAYYQATGAHYQEDLDPASLRGPVWDTLDVTTLLSLPSYFVDPLGPQPPSGSSTVPVPFPSQPVSRRRRTTPAPRCPPTCPSSWPRAVRIPGTSVVSFPSPDGRWASTVAGPATCRPARSPPPAPFGGWRRSSGSGRTPGRRRPGQAASAGVVVRNRSRRPVVVGVPVVQTAEVGPVALDGRMQYGV